MRSRRWLVTLSSELLLDEPSVLLNEGNIIRDGWNGELDGLRMLKRDARAVLEAYLEEERADLGPFRPAGEVQQDHRVLPGTVEKCSRMNAPTSLCPAPVPVQRRALYHRPAGGDRVQDQRRCGAHHVDLEKGALSGLAG
jgi:hypothetical protein